METTTGASRATEILMAEHEVILNVLDCLQKLADDSSRAETFDVRSAKDILEFFGAFADKCHHGKEEGALFPMLFQKGLPRHVGPVAVMLSEHEEGRAEIAGMRAAIAALEQGHSEGVQRFVGHARAYVELLRDHIAKENTVLFPMADGMLNPAEQSEVLDRFATVESKDLGPGTHERYVALAADLVKRLNVTPSERSMVHAGGCCGHGTRCH
jgi:hemerythrin-like domain-containing protein